MKVEIPSLKFNFINGLVKRSNLNFKYNCSIWSKRNQLALRKKLRKELGPQQPSKYIELPTLGPVYQLWPISTKLLSTSIQNLIIQSKQFSCQYKDILIPSEIILKKKKKSLQNDEQIIKIECKTNRISQKWKKHLKSRKKIISRKTGNKFILLI